jgi:hypothetical protein
VKTDSPRATLRHLVLWLVLSGLFLAIYELYRTPGSSHDWAPTVLLVALIGSIGGVAVWASALRRATQRFNAKSLGGLDRIARGDLDTAAQIFAELVAQTRRPGLRAVALLNQSYVELRRGRVAEALNGFARVERTAGQIGALASGHLAVACVIAGRLDETQRWIERATANLAKVPTARSLIGTIPFARAALGCRRGNPAEVVRDLDEKWTRLDHSLAGELLRPLRAVRALALEAAGGDARTLEGQLAVLAEGRPGDLVWMGAEWPEMRDFLAKHGLAGAPAPIGAIEPAK